MANTDPCNFQPRYHLSCSYKAAIEIYASHVICEPAAQQYLSRPYISGLIDFSIMHLTAIDPQDAHFKGLVWPAFVTGAEAQTTAQRTVIKAVFGHLCEFWQCQMLITQ